MRTRSGPSAWERGKQIVQTTTRDHKERWPWLPRASMRLDRRAQDSDRPLGHPSSQGADGNLNERLTLIGDAWPVQ